MTTPRPHTRRLAIAGVAVATALAVGGCGSSSGSSSTDTGGSDAAATAIEHVDGTIKVSGSTITVTPTAGGGGGGTLQLTLGSQVKPGQVQAMSASGEAVRVLYRGDTAVGVQAVSAAAKEHPHVSGTITKVSDNSLTLATDDGDKTFTIRDAERDAMDVPHLHEHQQTKVPVTVYYDGNAAIYYEDA